MSAVNNGGGAAADQKQYSTLSTLVGPTYTTYGSQFAIKRQRNANIMLPTLLLGARRSTLHGLWCSYKASCSLFQQISVGMTPTLAFQVHLPRQSRNFCAKQNASKMQNLYFFPYTYALLLDNFAGFVDA
jgi:hypothetical protein